MCTLHLTSLITYDPFAARFIIFRSRRGLKPPETPLRFCLPIRYNPFMQRFRKIARSENSPYQRSPQLQCVRVRRAPLVNVPLGTTFVSPAPCCSFRAVAPKPRRPVSVSLPFIPTDPPLIPPHVFPFFFLFFLPSRLTPNM